MPIILVELDPDYVRVDESRFQQDLLEQFVIYEHMLYYCSKLTKLPAISIQIDNGTAFVIRRHWYLSIAKDLRAPRIRAVIEDKTNFAEIQRFLRKTSVTQIDWEEARKAEEDQPVYYGWLVFFFERALTERERRTFEDQVVDFYRSIKLPRWFEHNMERIINLSYTHGGLCAEFQALTPFGDERWYPTSRAVLKKFHDEMVPLISFQGNRIEFD